MNPLSSEQVEHFLELNEQPSSSDDEVECPAEYLMRIEAQTAAIQNGTYRDPNESESDASDEEDQEVAAQLESDLIDREEAIEQDKEQTLPTPPPEPSSWYECTICYDQRNGPQIARCGACDQHFCSPCFARVGATTRECPFCRAAWFNVALLSASLLLDDGIRFKRQLNGLRKQIETRDALIVGMRAEISAMSTLYHKEKVANDRYLTSLLNARERLATFASTEAKHMLQAHLDAIQIRELKRKVTELQEELKNTQKPTPKKKPKKVKCEKKENHIVLPFPTPKPTARKPRHVAFDLTEDNDSSEDFTL